MFEWINREFGQPCAYRVEKNTLQYSLLTTLIVVLEQITFFLFYKYKTVPVTVQKTNDVKYTYTKVIVSELQGEKKIEIIINECLITWLFSSFIYLSRRLHKKNKKKKNRYIDEWSLSRLNTHILIPIV